MADLYLRDWIRSGIRRGRDLKFQNHELDEGYLDNTIQNKSHIQQLVKRQNLLVKTIIYSVYLVHKSALYRQWIKFLQVGSQE